MFYVIFWNPSSCKNIRQLYTWWGGMKKRKRKCWSCSCFCWLHWVESFNLCAFKTWGEGCLNQSLYMGCNKSKISRVVWAPGIRKLRALNFFRTRFGFSNIFYTSGTEISHHFQAPLRPLALHFEGPKQIFWCQLARGAALFRPLNLTRRDKVKDYIPVHSAVLIALELQDSPLTGLVCAISLRRFPAHWTVDVILWTLNFFLRSPMV